MHELALHRRSKPGVSVLLEALQESLYVFACVGKVSRLTVKREVVSGRGRHHSDRAYRTGLPYATVQRPGGHEEGYFLITRNLFLFIFLCKVNVSTCKGAFTATPN